MKRNDRHFFTLIELLVVIGIIAVLAAMLMPALGKAREKASQTSCMNQLRQISLSIFSYKSDNRDAWPYWISQLFPDYINSRKVYHCPSSKKNIKDPHPYDGDGAKFCYDDGNNEGYHKEDPSAIPNIGDGKKNVDYVNYLYQMNDADATGIIGTWFQDGGKTYYNDCKTMADCKEVQLEYGDKVNDYKAYDPTIFPILSCFFHVKVAKVGKHEESAPVLQISYSGNFFMSRVQWELGQWTP